MRGWWWTAAVAMLIVVAYLFHVNALVNQCERHGGVYTRIWTLGGWGCVGGEKK